MSPADGCFTEEARPEPVHKPFARLLHEVREQALAVAFEGVAEALREPISAALGGGQMLRARLTLRLAVACGPPSPDALAAAVAVELAHAGSLLHDDVIDGGRLRRGAPAFWTRRGIPGAVLMGDLLFAAALRCLLSRAQARLLHELIAAMTEVCSGETEQELVRRGEPGSWQTSLDLARRKTGPLFAFAAIAAGTARQYDALYAAGSDLGTAYQLADDLLDAGNGASPPHKTLGDDAKRDKPTACRADWPAGEGPHCRIEKLCAAAAGRLADWPSLTAGLDRYMARDFQPALQRMRA